MIFMVMKCHHNILLLMQVIGILLYVAWRLQIYSSVSNCRGGSNKRRRRGGKLGEILKVWVYAWGGGANKKVKIISSTDILLIFEVFNLKKHPFKICIIEFVKNSRRCNLPLPCTKEYDAWRLET